MWPLDAILDSTGIYIPRSRIAQKSMCLNFMVIAKLPFREVVPVYIPLGWKIVYHWVLICIYFITYEVEHLFICLKAIYISFSVDNFYFLCPYSFLLDWSFSPQTWENENNPFMCYKCCSLPSLALVMVLFCHAKMFTFYAIEISIFIASEFYHAYRSLPFSKIIFKIFSITSSNPHNKFMKRVITSTLQMRGWMIREILNKLLKDTQLKNNRARIQIQSISKDWLCLLFWLDCYVQSNLF